MPFTFNGIGTALRGYSSPISWTRPGTLGLAMVLVAVGLLSAFVALRGVLSGRHPVPQVLEGVGVAALVCALGYGGFRWLRSRDARTRDVRLVILAHPEVQAALPALRREPWRRGELLKA